MGKCGSTKTGSSCLSALALAVVAWGVGVDSLVA